MPKLIIYAWLMLLLITACNTTRSTAIPIETASQPADRPTVSASNTPIPTRTPFEPVRLEVSPTLACTDAPRTRLIIGERGRVLDDDNRPLNVRNAPGTDNEVLRRLEILTVFDVLEGPQCRDQYAWFYIRSGSLEGWVAEGDTDVYYVEPYFPG